MAAVVAVVALLLFSAGAEIQVDTVLQRVGGRVGKAASSDTLAGGVQSLTSATSDIQQVLDGVFSSAHPSKAAASLPAAVQLASPGFVDNAGEATSASGRRNERGDHTIRHDNGMSYDAIDDDDDDRLRKIEQVRQNISSARQRTQYTADADGSSSQSSLPFNANELLKAATLSTSKHFNTLNSAVTDSVDTVAELTGARRTNRRESADSRLLTSQSKYSDWINEGDDFHESRIAALRHKLGRDSDTHLSHDDIIQAALLMSQIQAASSKGHRRQRSLSNEGEFIPEDILLKMLSQAAVQEGVIGAKDPEADLAAAAALADAVLAGRRSETQPPPPREDRWGRGRHGAMHDNSDDVDHGGGDGAYREEFDLGSRLGASSEKCLMSKSFTTSDGDVINAHVPCSFSHRFTLRGDNQRKDNDALRTLSVYLADASVDEIEFLLNHATDAELSQLLAASGAMSDHLIDEVPDSFDSPKRHSVGLGKSTSDGGFSRYARHQSSMNPYTEEASSSVYPSLYGMSNGSHMDGYRRERMTNSRCSEPVDSGDVEEYLRGVSRRERMLIRSFLSDLDRQENNSRRYNNQHISKERITEFDRRDIQLRRGDRSGNRGANRRYACPEGRVRLSGGCSLVEAPLMQCSSTSSMRIRSNSFCRPRSVADLICPDGFELQDSECVLEFDPITECPPTTSLLGGMCVTTEVASSIISRVHPTESSSCPTNTLSYRQQCLPTNSTFGDGRGSRRNLVTKNVIATCPSGYIPVDGGSILALNVSEEGQVNSVGGKVCARIVEAIPVCPESFNIVQSEDGTAVCERHLRNKPSTLKCGVGMTQSADGMECVGKIRNPLSNICERGRFDGKRCVEVTREAPLFDCPEGFHLQRTDMGVVCEETVKSGRKLEKDHTGRPRRLMQPTPRCASPLATYSADEDACVVERPTNRPPVRGCRRDEVAVENWCEATYRKKPNILCKDPSTGVESKGACEARTVLPSTMSCPKGSSELCWQDKQRRDDKCSGLCLHKIDALPSRGRKLESEDGAVQFCPVGSQMVESNRRMLTEFQCVIREDAMVPQGCTSPEDSPCPSGGGKLLCGEGFTFAVDRRICVEI